MKILILRIILRKLQNSKRNSKNKTTLRIRMLVNTSPGILYFVLEEGEQEQRTGRLSTLCRILFLQDLEEGEREQSDWEIVYFMSYFVLAGFGRRRTRTE